METRCENCGILITWQPTVVDGQAYCCLGCAVGGPCSCDYSNLPSLEESRAIVRAASVIMLGAGSSFANDQARCFDMPDSDTDDHLVP